LVEKKKRKNDVKLWLFFVTERVAINMPRGANKCIAPAWHISQLHVQGGPKKTAPNFSCNNFGKYRPILIMFSLLHSQMN